MVLRQFSYKIVKKYISDLFKCQNIAYKTLFWFNWQRKNAIFKCFLVNLVSKVEDVVILYVFLLSVYIFGNNSKIKGVCKITGRWEIAYINKGLDPRDSEKLVVNKHGQR